MFRENLRAYILENFLFTDDQSELNDDESFRDNNYIDSTGILEIIEFIEENSNIIIEDNDMRPENFDSVNKIVSFVQSRLSNRIDA